MRGEIAKLCLVIATLALERAAGEGACERGRSWWHRQRGACVPCTRCDPRRHVVKFPCELHRDTICQPLREVRIWPFNTEHSSDNEPTGDYEYYESLEYADYSGEVKDELEWDVQTSTLTVGVCGCVVFFVVVLTLTLYHAKQWRTLKLALKSGKLAYTRAFHWQCKYKRYNTYHRLH